jgi:poly(A) polymerase
MQLADSAASRLAMRAIEKLRSRGFQALLVGGCVRDLLLARPVADYDIATDARPEQVAALFPGASLVGAHFGVVLVRDAEAEVQVATFRSDHAYRDGRHPEHVEFETDPREDAARRDFTINALFWDPCRDELLDFVGGRADLESRLIRAVGEPEQRFYEDHLRMLRAVRFAARLDFRLDPPTANAIRRLAPLARRVAVERVRDELVRILTEGGAGYGFQLLHSTCLLHELLPEVEALRGVEQPPDYHPEGDVWTHTLLMLDALRNPRPTLALGVLLHDIGKPQTFRRAHDRIRFDGHVERGVEIARAILNRFRFSSQEIEQVLALVAHHMRFADVRRMRDATLKRFLRLPHFDEHLELHRLDCMASHGNLDNYEYAQRKLAELSEEQLHPPRLVSGEDLIALGFEPGPRFRDILAAVEDAQLDGVLATRDEAIAWIEERFHRNRDHR